jgi:hypothetical protein
VVFVVVLALVRRLENYFRGFLVEHIERAKNTEADELVKATAMKTTLPLDLVFKTLEDSSMKTVEQEPRTVNAMQLEDWLAPIIEYLRHHYEPNNKTELPRMQQRVKAYQVIGNELYKTSVKGSLLYCLSNLSKTWPRLSNKDACDFILTMMSSTYTSIKSLMRPPNVLCIAHTKVGRAFLRP